MFLIDTLFDRGTTEPYWFKITRIAVAFGLSIIALLYAFHQIISLLSNQFIVAITEEPIIPPSMPAPALSTANVSFNLSEYLYPSPLFSFPGQDSALNSKNGLSSVNFSKIGISDHQLYVKFDTMNVNNNTYTDYNYPSILLEAGDSSIITISPTIKGSYYHNLKRFLGYSGDRDQFYLTPTITTLPKLTDERQIQFAIIQRQYLRYEIQTSHSTKRYVAFAGIPLSQKVSNRRNNATLEDRVQMLETMLQEYYLDNYQWELLRKSILKYDRLQRQYDQMTLKEIIDSDSEII
ncbi:1457_t:CDS:2 [Gigaspora margarita]|uniref:1457_t:CDS:1 n=1 Tax=Gigaspora margarita TaxID=4874 RepID=A0ABN7VEM7_GIGMA|nr:1457_t:CDS:2 [Gigaspora margarita]